MAGTLGSLSVPYEDILSLVQETVESVRHPQRNHQVSARVDSELQSPVKKPFRHALVTPQRSPHNLPRLAGKSTLNSSLERVHRDLLSARAGHRHSLFGHSPLSRLPSVSLTNGRLIPPLELPSYTDFVKQSAVEDQSPIDRLDALRKSIDDLPEKFSGLELFCKANPGAQWARAPADLLKIHANPHWASNLSEQEELELAKTRRPKPRERVQSPEQIYFACKSRFNTAQRQQDSTLVTILDKFTQGRSFIANEKLKILSRSRYGQHPLKHFRDVNRELESKRTGRLKRVSNHSDVYQALLQCLRRRTPKPVELRLLDALKAELERGVPLERHVLETVLETFTEREKRELSELLNLLCLQLELSPLT